LRIGEIRTEEIGLVQIGPGQNRSSELRRDQVRFGEIRAGHVRLAQVRVHQVGRVHRCAAQAHPGEVDAGEDHAIQIRAIENDSHVWMLTTPHVPRPGSELQASENVFGHVRSAVSQARIAVGHRRWVPSSRERATDAAAATSKAAMTINRST